MDRCEVSRTSASTRLKLSNEFDSSHTNREITLLFPEIENSHDHFRVDSFCEPDNNEHFIASNHGDEFSFFLNKHSDTRGKSLK